jgi:hypothetical protein
MCIFVCNDLFDTRIFEIKNAGIPYVIAEWWKNTAALTILLKSRFLSRAIKSSYWVKADLKV